MVSDSSDTPNGALVGREWLLTDILQWMDAGGQRAVLSGPPGIGKSRVAREVGERVPGALMVNFAALTARTDWPESLTPAALKGRVPSLLILDGVEHAPSALWRSERIEADFPGIPKLFVIRHGVHAEGLARPGNVNFSLSPDCPQHSADMSQYLALHGLNQLEGLLGTFREAQFLINNPQHGAQQLDQYYLALWRETTRPHSGTARILVEQVALLLADAPEGLSLETISDFTGVPLVQVREAIDDISPILIATTEGLTLFSHGMSSFLTRTFSRDLGPVHGRIVTFFRETYPSWQEMHDPYGWRYLVLHCDRLARASRRKDFSILHWLNEGSFSQLKLERTGMLPSVLKDLQLSLMASLETGDLPRVISFGCRLARLRKHESITTVHRLADSGQLAMARDNAFLVSGETQRFLIWILFATQALEFNDFASARSLLEEACNFPTLHLNELETELAASLLGVLLTHPKIDEETCNIIEQLLEMDGDPHRASQAFKCAGRLHLLPRDKRVDFFSRALEWAENIPQSKAKEIRLREIRVRLARLSPETLPKVRPFPDTLSKAKNSEKAFQKMLKAVKAGEAKVATVAAALIPVSEQDWACAAYLNLTRFVAAQEEGEDKWHSLSGLLQSIEDANFKDVDDLVLDSLSIAILNLECAEQRSRYLARFAILLTAKQRPMDAQQRISLSASSAFSLVDTEERSLALLNLAAWVAATGALGRARDLAFHALELNARVGDLARETRQLVGLMGSSGTVTQSADEIVRLGENLRFDNSAPEREAKGRALVTLAAGLARLGAVEQAKLYREKAIETTRAIENVELRIHLLTDLAGALYSCDEKKEARRLVKEAKAEYEAKERVRGLLSAVALLRVYIIFENRTQTKKCFERCVKFVKKNAVHAWLGSPALLELLHLAQHLGKTDQLLPALEEARSSEDLTDGERLGLLRCELQLGDFEAAEGHLALIQGLTARCQAGVDMATALLPVNDYKAIEFLGRVPLESARCEGIRRLAMLNSTEIRPTELPRVRRVLKNLTMMAIDHPNAMDAVLSRWLQNYPSQETILAVADKMGWDTSTGPSFGEAFAARTPQPEPEEVEAPAPPAPEPSQEDDGFEAVELTRPRS